MVLLWAGLVLLVFALLICFAVLRFQALHIERRKDLFREALWKRRNKIPLFLEVMERSGTYSKRNEVVVLRGKVLSEAYSLLEQMDFEKKLTAYLEEVFRQSGNGVLKSDSLYLSLEKELRDELESIRIAANDYDFELQKWQKLNRFPLFKILGFGFKIDENLVGGLI